MYVGMLTDERLSTYQVFKRDTNYSGTEVSNHSKTESWQRAKCLSSRYQWASRYTKIDTLQDSIRTKEAEEIKKYNEIHKNKSSCIEPQQSPLRPS